MRKRHGIEPAMSGFYHEPIVEETERLNSEWAALRATKSSR